MRINFDETCKLYGTKKGICEKCGKRAMRQITIEHTVNPYNRNIDGTVKTKDQVYADVLAELKKWESAPIYHAKCETIIWGNRSS